VVPGRLGEVPDGVDHHQGALPAVRPVGAGLTEKDFALAKKIEEVVGWQPGLEGGALEGTPTDPRFA
jgi:hypothetical protein